MTDLTHIATEGYNATEFAPPHLFSSHNDAAWRIGRWLNKTGRTAPRAVRPSRGYTYHVNDMLVRIEWLHGDCTITRVR